MRGNPLYHKSICFYLKNRTENLPGFFLSQSCPSDAKKETRATYPREISTNTRNPFLPNRPHILRPYYIGGRVAFGSVPFGDGDTGDHSGQELFF